MCCASVQIEILSRISHEAATQAGTFCMNVCHQFIIIPHHHLPRPHCPSQSPFVARAMEYQFDYYLKTEYFGREISRKKVTSTLMVVRSSVSPVETKEWQLIDSCKKNVTTNWNNKNKQPWKVMSIKFNKISNAHENCFVDTFGPLLSLSKTISPISSSISEHLT